MKNVPGHKAHARATNAAMMNRMCDEIMSGSARNYDDAVPSRQVMRQIARTALTEVADRQTKQRRKEAQKALEKRQGADTTIRKAAMRAVSRLSMYYNRKKARMSQLDAF